MESVTFRIHGLPAPKGSVTQMPNGAYLPAGTAASRMKFSLWKENISVAARAEMGERKPWHGAIRMMAEFQLPVPKSMPKNQRGWLPHIKRPDWDKLTRALADPLKGIVWVDDSQVCFSTINKVYAWDNQPGCFVIIDFLTDEWNEKYGAASSGIRNVIDSL
jgi:Holliday junction resolvase RusA-like endonuclease